MEITRSHRTAVPIIVALLCCLLVTGVVEAREVQLAGMRLGQHAVNLLDIYGQPDGIGTAQGEAYAVGAPGVGVDPGMEPMNGMPMEDPGMPMEPMDDLGPGAFPEDDMPMDMEPGVPDAPAPAVAGVQRNPYPMWALPVWVDLGANEVQWLYHVKGSVLGFVLDRDGYIQSIAIAGEKSDFARTSLWQPHRYVQLGDSYSRVIYRYGWPDETLTYHSTGPGAVGTGGGQIAVSFGGTVREFSRDSILRYTEYNNIEFTFHNMRCVRIHIWMHE